MSSHTKKPLLVDIGGQWNRSKVFFTSKSESAMQWLLSDKSAIVNECKSLRVKCGLIEIVHYHGIMLVLIHFLSDNNIGTCINWEIKDKWQ